MEVLVLVLVLGFEILKVLVLGFEILKILVLVLYFFLFFQSTGTGSGLYWDNTGYTPKNTEIQKFY